jgi:hypothetical protein
VHAVKTGLGLRASGFGPRSTWRPPTRRAFVQMLAAAAAALALKQKQSPPKLKVWIGHF